ncbi:MAG: glycosyltransferase, partial [Nitrospinota bacterium]|nr:glycosyltransferase [Nitrospinota bacterium]
MSRKQCSIKDGLGHDIPITLPLILQLLRKGLTDMLQIPFLLRQVKKEIFTLSKSCENEKSKNKLDLSRAPVYLRTDLLYGMSAGGSISHISGVLNNLDQTGVKPVLLSTDTIPTIRPDLLSLLIQPGNDFLDFSELPDINFTASMFSKILTLLTDVKISFLYQRYSLHNYSGVQLARHFNAPLVLEYNGSEIWIRQNWSKGLRYKKLAEQIELLNLNCADVVVVVSQALKDKLLSRGIDSNKILVNPNGVDPDVYSPQVVNPAFRSRFDWNDKIVLGFIGTFGPWHGAEILAKAYGLLLK